MIRIRPRFHFRLLAISRMADAQTKATEIGNEATDFLKKSGLRRKISRQHIIIFHLVTII
jgi:hypothetical protein